MSEKASWRLERGDDIVPGRTALKRLGGGKRYEAYLAWDEKLFSQVVVKLLRPDQADDSRALKDLAREAEIMHSLAHPVVVRGFGAMIEGPRPHVVMELFEGPTLRRLIKNYGSLPLEQLVPLAVQVCGALHYLSTESIVHLDVKPSNVVMGAPPKLIDLSIARTIEAAQRLNGPVGTRAYMAPEQCRPGEGAPIGPPTDVWGMGATLYEAVTRAKPFPASSDNGRDEVPLHPQIDSDPQPFPKDTPEMIEELILGCLTKDPAERPTAAELAHSFEPLLAGIPTRPRLRRRRPRLR